MTLLDQSLAEPQANDDIEDRLREFFDENYELLRVSGGHQLAPDVLEGAFQQVVAYWRKLRGVAEKVTETEVRLTLPDQKTPQGRKFGIMGVVDIVREDGHTTMYDLKTHEADYVRANVAQYAPQLNVYAYIWQNLRGQELNETAIISTVLPVPLREAISSGDDATAARLLEKWDPLIEVPFNGTAVNETIVAFGHVVDRIEDHKFAPPSVEKLKTRITGQAATFATSVCRNCDARFSCTTYRAYALGSGLAVARTFRQYFQDTATDNERDDWLGAGLTNAEMLNIEDYTA